MCFTHRIKTPESFYTLEKPPCQKPRGQKFTLRIHLPRQAFSPYASRHLLSSAVNFYNITHVSFIVNTFFIFFFIFFSQIGHKKRACSFLQALLYTSQLLQFHWVNFYTRSHCRCKCYTLKELSLNCCWSSFDNCINKRLEVVR